MCGINYEEKRIMIRTIKQRMSLKMAFMTLATVASVSLSGQIQAATLEVAIDSSPAGLDPHLITAFNSVVIVQSTVYEGLTAVQQDLSVGAGLASSWTVSDDSLTYEFTLPVGATFHAHLE
jgi:peptide/nickel transport system substrate-binding protein